MIIILVCQFNFILFIQGDSESVNATKTTEESTTLKDFHHDPEETKTYSKDVSSIIDNDFGDTFADTGSDSDEDAKFRKSGCTNSKIANSINLFTPRTKQYTNYAFSPFSTGDIFSVGSVKNS